MLMILDGWGENEEVEGNAVKQAHTPHLDQLLTTYPVTRLACSGQAVGLPDGIMGNSEVGHLNIGAGRIVYQDLMKIDMAIQNGSFQQNPVIGELFDTINTRRSALHLMGLVSDGGVHSHIRHLLALLDLAKQSELPEVYVHAILDGRDTAPDSGVGFIRQLHAYMQENHYGVIATICGRYYAMDRDTRWDRTQKAFECYTQRVGVQAKHPVEAVKEAYQRGETDEFVKPVALCQPDGTPYAAIKEDDGILFFNFRADRARQITRAFTEDAFDAFKREQLPALSQYVCMTAYDEKFDLPVVFKRNKLSGILGEVISNAGLKQLRIAETEKYAHVTYFFNGGDEKPYLLEDRCLIPSPRDIPTYEYKPEMSAREVTQEVLSRIATNTYDLVVLNFANMDMVGHTGVLEAAIKACETLDGCIGQIVDAVQEKGGVILITADHGNAEKMLEKEGAVHTAHTHSPVRLILVDDSRQQARLKTGKLGDIAPTILQIMGIEKPPQMTGESLLVAD
jgi:2,3-bisphosphoglycerate-independent phosphoglycerate mutase